MAAIQSPADPVQPITTVRHPLTPQNPEDRPRVGSSGAEDYEWPTASAPAVHTSPPAHAWATRGRLSVFRAAAACTPTHRLPRVIHLTAGRPVADWISVVPVAYIATLSPPPRHFLPHFAEGAPTPSHRRQCSASHQRLTLATTTTFGDLGHPTPPTTTVRRLTPPTGGDFRQIRLRRRRPPATTFVSGDLHPPPPTDTATSLSNVDKDGDTCHRPRSTPTTRHPQPTTDASTAPSSTREASTAYKKREVAAEHNTSSSPPTSSASRSCHGAT